VTTRHNLVENDVFLSAKSKKSPRMSGQMLNDDANGLRSQFEGLAMKISSIWYHSGGIYPKVYFLEPVASFMY
jgi:hypothetical protein